MTTTPGTMQSDPTNNTSKLAAKLDSDTRKELLRQVRAGELTELDVDIVAFCANYPNSNFYRFRDSDLPTFAASFAQQPFLRNHDVRDVGARDGTITAGRLENRNFHQTLHITTQRGLEDFLQGRIDRFSIGWYYEDIHCSICNESWLECSHWPGRKYKGPAASDPEHLCELIFVNPSGKETSAVNAPAVKGTRVLTADGNDYAFAHLSADLAALCERKLAHQKEVQNSKQTPTTTPSATPQSTTPTPALEQTTEPEPLPHHEDPMDNEITTPPTADVTPPPAPVNPPPPPSLSIAPPAPVAPAASSEPAPVAAPPAPTPDPQAAAWLSAMREATISTMLQASRLSAESCDAVRAALGPDTDPQQIAKLIEAQRKVEARLADNHVVVGINPSTTGRPANVSGMLNGNDKFKEALFALLDNRRPEHKLKPLAGLREAYVLASGDWEMTGRFKPMEVSLANINSSSLPDLMAEWLNQRVVTIWQSYDQWYRMFCDIQQFSSLRDPHWIKIGGVGELSTVGEGSAYTEKEWSAESETTQWTKRGNWVGVTIEAIDRDMTGYVQQLPKALAQGAWLTISKDFTRRLITATGAGYGYNMASDNKALFHADHSNLGNTALSYAAWEATRLAMARQTEQGTGEVLGGLTLPRYMMVPRHLETTAIALLATERVQGSGNNDITPLSVDGDSISARKDAARRMLVVNDFLGTRNDWFAFADPARFPLFGLGFRWGEAPEIFSVADPTSGLMFSNDVMPIKIRWYYSLGAIDYRGMYYQRVG